MIKHFFSIFMLALIFRAFLWTLPSEGASLLPSSPTRLSSARDIDNEVVTLSSVLTATKNPTATVTISVTLTVTPTISATVTTTPTLTATPTMSVTVTPTSTISPTLTATPTATISVTNTPTVTLTATLTETVTPSTTPTLTATIINTLTPTATETQPSGTATPTSIIIHTNTATPSPTIKGTLTHTSTPSPTITGTNTPTPSATITETLTHTSTPSPTVTTLLTNTPTATKIITSTPTMTGTFTITPVITLTATDSPTSSATPTSSLTATPTEAPTASATKTSSTFLLYLPLIVKPATIFNGNFETGSFSGWNLDLGQGEYPLQIITTDGDFAARIGNPQAECNGGSPMNDKVAFYQTISIPNSQSASLSFSYRLLSQDDSNFERLNLYIQPTNNPNGAPIWTEGAPPPATQCDEPTFDSSWQSVTLSLSKYQAQSVTLRFELESEDDTPFFNTWLYIDDIEINP